MLGLEIFFTNLLPIVGVAAVLTVPPIVGSIVFAATDNPTAVELNPIGANEFGELTSGRTRPAALIGTVTHNNNSTQIQVRCRKHSGPAVYLTLRTWR